MQAVMEEREMPMELHDAQFKRIDERFDDVNRQFEQIDKRFDRVEGDIREMKQGLFAVQATLNRFVLGAATSWVILMVTILARG